MHVLIVDDQVSLVKGLLHACKKKDWVAEFALSAEEALRVLREKHFDGIVSDLRMPGLSGLAFVKEVLHNTKAEGEKPFFILISAYLTLEDSLQALRLGVSDLFQKPFEIETLLGRMEELWALKKMSKKNSLIPISESRLARWMKGWDEYFLVEQKVSAEKSYWNYFSMPKKINTALRVGIGFDCSPKIWARLEGALLLSLEQEVSLAYFFDFLKVREADLLLDEKKQGLCVLDVQGDKCWGLFFGNLRGKGFSVIEGKLESDVFQGTQELDFEEVKTVQFSPLSFSGTFYMEPPVFFLTRKLKDPRIPAVDFENGKIMETLSYFGDCLAERKWEFTDQVQTLSCLAEILTLCQEWRLKNVSVCLEENSLRVEGSDLSKQWQNSVALIHQELAQDSPNDLLRVPSSEDFLKRLTGEGIRFEGDVLCFTPLRSVS